MPLKQRVDRLLLIAVLLHATVGLALVATSSWLLAEAYLQGETVGDDFAAQLGDRRPGGWANAKSTDRRGSRGPIDRRMNVSGGNASVLS